MTKAYAPDVKLIGYVDKDGKDHTAMVITIGYEDGRVIQQWGEGEDWIEIKRADSFRKIAGICKDCDDYVFMDQEYKFSSKEGWCVHIIEEDCKKDGGKS